MNQLERLSEAADVHLGRRAFLAGAAAGIAGLTVLSGAEPAAALEAGACYFASVNPERLCDTRPRGGLPAGFGYVRLDANTIRVQVTGRAGIDRDARAAVLTVTGVMPRVWNFLTVYPAGERRPEVSSVNLAAQDFAVANLVTVKLGPTGAVDIFQFSPCDVIVDVAGAYRPAAGPMREGRLVAFPSARRVLDTRITGRPGAGQVVRVNLNGHVPADASAIVANLTAVEASIGGYVTAYPRGTAMPATSSVNVGPGQTRAAGIMTKLAGAEGAVGIDLYIEQSTHLVVDIAGYVTGPSGQAGGASLDGMFVPVTPFRVVDTRQGTSRRVWDSGTKTFGLPAPMNSRAQAVAMNLTVTGTLGGGGYFTLFAAQTPRYEVSNLNANSGETIANHAISRVSAAGVSCFSFRTAHVIADVFGWFTGVPAPMSTPPAYSPPPPPAIPPYIVSIPRLGLTRWVYGDATPNHIVDAGNIWHWTGSALAGQGANVVVFGHRTEHGGPLRYQHTMQGGDRLHLLTNDQRRFEYQLVAEAISSGWGDEILAHTRAVGGETVSVVSCSKTNRLPTDTRFRLISTFSLVGWEDLG